MVGQRGIFRHNGKWYFVLSPKSQVLGSCQCLGPGLNTVWTCIVVLMIVIVINISIRYGLTYRVLTEYH